MVKRKLKQTTGNLTVVVNVGGVPTKKVRKKRGKSRARGGGSVRPAKNFVVSYTDQTPTLNLLKEFSETNRLLLTGRNNLMLEAPAAPARIAAQTSDPSVMGTAYSIDTTHKYDRPRPNRLAPEPPAPDPPAPARPAPARPAPSAPARPAQGRQAAESQDLSGFRKLASHFRGRKERGKPSYPQIIHTTKEEYERDIMRREDRPWSPSRKMPPVPPRPKKMETTGTNTPPVLPPRPPPKMTTTGAETLPQRPPPNMTTTGAETLPQRPPPNRTTTGAETLPQRPPPNRTIGTNTALNTTTTGTSMTPLEEMPPPPLLKRESSSLDRPPERPNMVSRGEETLPQQASQATREATQLARGVMEDIAKTKSQLSVKEQELKDTRKKLNRAEFDVELGAKLVTLRGNEITQLQKDLEQEKKSRMPQRPPPNMTTTGAETLPQRPPPNMVSTGTEMPQRPPNMDTGTNTALFKTTTTGTEMAQMTTTGVETLPQRTPPNRQDPARTSRELSGTLVQTKRELAKSKKQEELIPALRQQLSQTQELLEQEKKSRTLELQGTLWHSEKLVDNLEKTKQENERMKMAQEEKASPAILESVRMARVLASDVGKTKSELKKTQDELDKARTSTKFFATSFNQATEEYEESQDNLKNALGLILNLEQKINKETRQKQETSQKLMTTKQELEQMKMATQDVRPKETIKEKKIRLAAEREVRASKLVEAAQAEDIDDDSPEKARQIRQQVIDQQRSSSEESVESMEDYDRLQRFSKQAVDAEMNQYDEDDPNYETLRQKAVAKEWAKTKAYSLRPFAQKILALNQVRKERMAPVKIFETEPKSRLATRLEERQASLDDLPPSAMTAMRPSVTRPLIGDTLGLAPRSAEQFRTRESADSEEGVKPKAPLKGIPKPTRPSVRPPRASKSRDLNK